MAINTVLLAGAVGSASLLLGAPLAFLLARTDVVGRKLWTLLLLTLLFTPLYLQAAAWQAAFGLQGWYTVATASPALLDGWRGAIAVHTLAAIPWVAIIVGVGLLLTNADLEEQALLDGAPGQVFRHVTLRRSANAMAAAFLWVVIATAGDITVTDLFQIRTYAEQIYTEFALGDRLDAPWKTLTSAIATAWIITAGLLLTSQLTPPDRNTPQRQRPTFRLRRWRIPLSVAIGFMVAALVGIPASSLLVKAGTIVTRNRCLGPRLVGEKFSRSSRRAPGDSRPKLAGPSWSARNRGNHGHRDRLAAGLERAAWRVARAPAWLVIAVCLALPGPLIGLGLIACFNTPNWPWLLWLYDRSIAAIWIAQTLRICHCARWSSATRCEPFPTTCSTAPHWKRYGSNSVFSHRAPRAPSGDCRGLVGGPGYGLGRAFGQHPGRAAGRDDAADPDIRAHPLRRRRPGGRHLVVHCRGIFCPGIADIMARADVRPRALTAGPAKG